MAADLLLHLNKEDYLAKIQELDDKLNQLRSLLADYQKLETDVTMFVQERDSNFENMRANVRANVDAVQRAIGITMKSKDTLQKTVDDMDVMSAQTSSMLSEAAEMAQNTIKTAIRVDGLL